MAADLDDPDALREAVRAIAPDFVIHTAGRTPPAADEALYRGNFWATIRLLNALRALNRQVRVTLAGSAAELGPVPAADLPVDEAHPCSPVDAYGRSKWLATRRRPGRAAAAGGDRRPGVQPGRPGPARDAGVRRVRRPALPLRAPIPCPWSPATSRPGATSSTCATRPGPWSRSALRGQPGHGLSRRHGPSRPVREGLDGLIRLSGRSVKVCVDPRRRARKGPTDSRADIRRIAAHTGWTPTIPFEQSLEDLWDEASKAARDRRPAAARGCH